jgi:ABC-type bacteriocin/lantibiotic exporter with double-glycine peptidase domain
VPFHPQAEEGCGASALASVLARLGRPADPAELAREVATPGLKGALVTDLADAARRRGFDAEVVQPDTEGVAALVSSGTAVILLLDEGRLAWSVPHYVVAFGILPEGLLVHSGDRPERVVPWWDLERKRSKMANLALVVRAKEGTR